MLSAGRKPAYKPKRKHRCCIVWTRTADHRLLLVCIHCQKVYGKPRAWADSQDLLVLLCERSVGTHAFACSIPVRPARAA